MANKIDVLIDRKNNNLSLTTIDDTTSEEVETTLSVAEAWSLVADINEALQKLALAAETRVQIVGNAKLNKDQIAELKTALDKAGASLFSVPADKVGLLESATPEQKEACIKAAMDYYASKTNAVATNPVPKSTHRPYSGTMNN
jgi:hypothetical protein